MTSLIRTEHPMNLAGKIWVFSEVRFELDFEGDLCLSAEELSRIHRVVCNEIVRKDSFLSSDEFEFLCEFTSTTFREIAEVAVCDPTTVSKWKSRGSVPGLESRVLKEFFWEKIFGKELAVKKDRPQRLSGKKRLEKMANIAVEEHLVEGRIVSKAG